MILIESGEIGVSGGERRGFEEGIFSDIIAASSVESATSGSTPHARIARDSPARSA